MRRSVLTGLAVAAVSVALLGCSDGPDDGWEAVASGDTYGEWELSAEYQGGEWTGCLRMDYEDSGPFCDDPDKDFIRFVDRTGAQYGASREGLVLEFADGEPLRDPDDLIEDRFWVVIEGDEVQVAE